LRAWELHHLGWTQARIAQAFGVSQGAVSQWLKRAQLAGLQALHAHPAPGRPALLSPAQLAQLEHLLLQGAEAFGFLGAVWTRECDERWLLNLVDLEYGTPRLPQ
jgi:transposase